MRWVLNGTPAEDLRAKLINKAKRSMCEHGVEPGSITTQPRRGVLWCAGKRVLEVRGRTLCPLPAYTTQLPELDSTQLVLWVQEQLQLG